MRIDIPEKYLNGAEIDTGANFNFADKLFDISRQSAIVRLISSPLRGVIHLGACDHKNVILNKINHNIWLHKLLTENSEVCVGFDINLESVAYCNELGWKNIYGIDMVNESERALEKLSAREVWDVLVAGEIVEHLDNPVDFLSRLHKIYKKRIKNLIVTVPNAFRILNAELSIRGIEGINTDHRYWFTPYTVSKVLYRAGFAPKELYYTGTRNIIVNNQNYFLDDSAISDDIIVIAEF